MADIENTLGGFAKIGNDVVVPRAFTASWSFEGDHNVKMEIRIEAGVPIVESIHIFRNPEWATISGTDVKRLPIGRLLKDALQSAAMERIRPGVIAPFEVGADLPPVPMARKRTTIDQTRLDEVAECWKIGQLFGSGTAAVAAELKVHPRQAARLVNKAIDAGVIPPRDQWSQ